MVRRILFCCKFCDMRNSFFKPAPYNFWSKVTPDLVFYRLNDGYCNCDKTNLIALLFDMAKCNLF